ncbi:MAG: hypothetical protein LBK99_13310 [Opitutaceae bacterium]|nr:hypothetical protein [Opitutaceae bacterium]
MKEHYLSNREVIRNSTSTRYGYGLRIIKNGRLLH